MSSRLVLPAIVLGRMLFGAIPSDAQVCQVLYPQAEGTLAMSSIRITAGGNNYGAAGTVTGLFRKEYRTPRSDHQHIRMDDERSRLQGLLQL